MQLPQEIALFWDALREGIREAAAPFAPAFQVEFDSYSSLGEGDLPKFEQALRNGTDGFIIAPGNPAALRPAIGKATRRGLPVVCVVTDAPDTQRLTTVSADPFTVGAVAGELLARWLPTRAKVAFFTGWLATQDHAEKLRGFEASLKTSGRNTVLGPVVEMHDDPREGYRLAKQAFKKAPDLKGVFVSTVNSLPVLQAASEAGVRHNLTIVTTDLFPELVGWIAEGKVAATIYQRPLTQGRLAVQAIYQYLLDGTCPPARIAVPPQIVMRSNLKLFLDRLSAGPTR